MEKGVTNKPEIVKSYRYEDEEGKLLFEVVRYEPKGFSQRRPFYADASDFACATPDESKGGPARRSEGEDGYIYNMQGVRRVLYKLPELIALPLEERVFIVEGEKDADRLIAEGLNATTNPGGAGKWLPEYNEYLRSRHIVIIPDNDEPGKKHSVKVAESLFGIAASVKILNLPGLPAKGDVSDFFNAGHKFGELSILADEAPEYRKERPGSRRADVVKMSEIEPEDVQWLWPGRFPLGMITLLVGDPDLGKSYLSLYLAATVSKGDNWPDGTPCPAAQALILNCEDALASTVRNRLQILNADADKVIAIRAMMENGANGDDITDNFIITTDRSELERILKENPGVRLVIIDPLSAYFGSADTFKESVVRSILAPLAAMAERYNVALVCIMHLNKGNSSKAVYRTQGSLAFPAAARAVWLVSNDPSDPNSRRRFLINVKFNIGERPSSLAFEIKDGRVVFEDKPVNITSQDVLTSQSNIEAPERDRAVEWLKQLLSDGQSMSSNEIFKLAKEEGFTEGTIRRAKKEIGIKSHIDFDENGEKLWYCKLPQSESKQLKLPNFKEELAKVNALIKRTKMP